jgi:hypothetical protein
MRFAVWPIICFVGLFCLSCAKPEKGSTGESYGNLAPEVAAKNGSFSAVQVWRATLSHVEKIADFCSKTNKDLDCKGLCSMRFSEDRSQNSLQISAGLAGQTKSSNSTEDSQFQNTETAGGLEMSIKYNAPKGTDRDGTVCIAPDQSPEFQLSLASAFVAAASKQKGDNPFRYSFVERVDNCLVEKKLDRSSPQAAKCLTQPSYWRKIPEDVSKTCVGQVARRIYGQARTELIDFCKRSYVSKAGLCTNDKPCFRQSISIEKRVYEGLNGSLFAAQKFDDNPSKSTLSYGLKICKGGGTSNCVEVSSSDRETVAKFNVGFAWGGAPDPSRDATRTDKSVCMRAEEHPMLTEFQAMVFENPYKVSEFSECNLGSKSGEKESGKQTKEVAKEPQIDQVGEAEIVIRAEDGSFKCSGKECAFW